MPPITINEIKYDQKLLVKSLTSYSPSNGKFAASLKLLLWRLDQAHIQMPMNVTKHATVANILKSVISIMFTRSVILIISNWCPVFADKQSLLPSPFYPPLHWRHWQFLHRYMERLRLLMHACGSADF